MRLSILGILLASFGVQAAESLPILGHPCEGCEAAFDGLPSVVSTRLQLAPADEPGVRMRVSGKIVDVEGRPRPGTILYVHQTDRTGIYPPPASPLTAAARRHGRLRGWVQADVDGRYQIDTIRPGSYPNANIPEHIHVQVIEPGCFSYFIDDVMFRDDPKLTAAQKRTLALGTGGNGVSTPRMVDGVWLVERDVILGKNVPGYRACAIADT